jgi:hypothetical protein
MGRIYRNFGCIPMAKAMLLSYNWPIKNGHVAYFLRCRRLDHWLILYSSNRQCFKKKSFLSRPIFKKLNGKIENELGRKKKIS